MLFKDLNLEQSYESDAGNLIETFYEPVLNCATKYFRLAGFFSSSSLAIAARGMSSFIKRRGQLLLVCSPILSPKDAEALTGATEYTLDVQLDFDNLESELERNHVKALGWMLSNGLLEIKLAVIVDDDGRVKASDNISKYGIFHQKVGVMEDSEGNMISFSGSINESATAWLKNDEEFKVFKSWDSTRSYVESDLKKFQSYWLNHKGKTRVFNLPEAVKAKMIQYSCDFDTDSISVDKYLSSKNASQTEDKKPAISLFSYQQEAVQKWIEHDYNLLFEMATGTGKTRTAIACIANRLAVSKSLIIIVSCPQSTLAQQWGGELSNLGIVVDKTIIVDGTNSKKAEQLHTALLEIQTGFTDTILILTTHVSASKQEFTSLMEKASQFVDVLFVGDEAHWLGAGKLKRALSKNYKYRIGLSATPTRWFDDDGSLLLRTYFGNNSFEFTIAQALQTENPLTGRPFLVKYKYQLIEVKLNEDEGMEYQEITRKLVRAYACRQHSDEALERYENLLIKRAKIVQNADSKYGELDRLLSRMAKDDDIRDLIIFVSPQQKDTVKDILSEHGIRFHELTEKQGTRRRREFGGLSEREHILKCFQEGQYQVIVAIKCLDEGIDIPTASKGILMASSTNPREYVQRIGRIIRQSPGKNRAYLYDMSVLGCDYLSDDERQLDEKLRRKEAVRIREIATNAINGYDAIQILNNYIEWH